MRTSPLHDVAFHTGPLPPAAATGLIAGAGAVLVFEGVARPTEGGRAIMALEYEAYQPMASRVLGELVATARARFGLLALSVQHSVGRVPAGACSLRVVVCAAHRKEALCAVEWLIDALKRDVPIWKKAVFAD